MQNDSLKCKNDFGNSSFSLSKPIFALNIIFETLKGKFPNRRRRSFNNWLHQLYYTRVLHFKGKLTLNNNTLIMI